MKSCRLLACLSIVMAGVVFGSCLADIEATIIQETDGPEALDGPILGGFTRAPVLTITGVIPDDVTDRIGRLQYSFTPAEPDTGNVTYRVLIAEGQHGSAGIIEASNENIFPFQTTLPSVWEDGETYIFNGGAARVGNWFSAIVIAETDTRRAVSGVRQAQSFSVHAEQGSGVFVSRGRSPYPGGRTYYIDFERGDDANNGQSALSPWKTLERANNHNFIPGDHILLEAESIWIGTPVTRDNFNAQRIARGNGGMFAPLSSGTEARPLVLDIYSVATDAGGAITAVYYSADKRPIINGNGTPSLSFDPYGYTGAVHLTGLNYWHIRNLEVTNSFDMPLFADVPGLRERHWYKWTYATNFPTLLYPHTNLDPREERGVPKPLAGVLAYGDSSLPGRPQHDVFHGLVVENCYIHDVQSAHNNNRSDNTWGANTYFGMQMDNPGKAGGGIGMVVNNAIIRGNVVRRTSYMGIRTMNNINAGGGDFLMEGNYIETVFGDAFVAAGLKGDINNWNLVQHNIVKDSCAAPNHGVGNYAAFWLIAGTFNLIQYNEIYGTMYGYVDGEAFDFDGDQYNSIYQYNYTHHNQGGHVLFLGSQMDNIVRFNISANDGIGTRGMYVLRNDGNSAPGALEISTAASSYTDYPHYQAIIHYASNLGLVAGRTIPLIHNNTFYIGDGYTVGLYGRNTTQSFSAYIRFFNNIVLKEGAGTIHLSYAHDQSLTTTAAGAGSVANPASGLRSNIFWGFERGQPDNLTFAQSKFRNGNNPLNNISGFDTTLGNVWRNPQLRIQGAGQPALLRQQRDTIFPEADYHNPARLDPGILGSFTSKERLRARASLFSPTNAAFVSGGMSIPSGGQNGGPVSSLDNAWNDRGVTEDIFGNTVNMQSPPFGAAVIPYTATMSVTN
ncbi:MAG: hypothetical protein FWG89_03355 [Treponema sp.]|nr:hypothetical protein [Treponema sp.]